MAAGDVTIAEGTPIVWADETDYAGGPQVGGTRTLDLDLTDLLFTAARQSVKADLGANRAEEFAVTIAVEFKTGEAPESAEAVKLYWGSSNSGTAGTDNKAGLDGTDSAYTGTAGDSLADSLAQLILIGVMSLTSDAVGVVQRDTFIFSPPSRYGQVVVLNDTDAEDFNAVDAEEMYVSMVPQIRNVEQ